MLSNLARDPRQYTFEVGEWLAVEHSKGDSVATIHQAHPDRIPAPIYITRWRKEFPAFDLLMTEAEQARAEVLADQTLEVADDKERNAASAGNAIKARQWLAARLNRGRFGTHKTTESKHLHDHSGTVNHRTYAAYSDEDLQAIIRGEAVVIEGEAVRIDEATPAPPPGSNRPGLEAKDGPDLQTPLTHGGASPVTTNTSKSGGAKNFGAQGATPAASEVPNEPEF